MVADIEELVEMDASEPHARRLNAKEVLTPMKGDIFIFPVADGTVKIFGREQSQRTSTLIRERPERGEEQEVLRGESDGLSSPTPVQDDSTHDDAEAQNDFWSITGDFICRHHVEPRAKLYMPREESFPIPLKYTDGTRNTHTSLDVLLEKNLDDYWNVDGERELSDARTGFTIFILLNERPPQDPTMCGQICGSICLMHQNAKRSKSGPSRNRSSIISDNYVVSDDEEFRHTMKNARRKWEIPMPAAMPCKTPLNCRGETCSSIGKRKTKYACIVDADESMRIRLEGVPQRYHEDHIATKGTNSQSHHNLVHKFFRSLKH